MEVVSYEHSALQFVILIFILMKFDMDICWQSVVSIVDNYSQNNFITTQDFESSRESRAQADLKFTYVVSCQIYGQQKQRKAPEAADIALLLQRYQFVCLLFSSAFMIIYYVWVRILCTLKCVFRKHRGIELLNLFA